jgi:3-methyladenine DNA glycosylase AlkC
LTEKALPSPRKGARTVATVDPDILAGLESGAIETANLTEGLAINMARLLDAVAPSLPFDSINLEAGVVQRMAQGGKALRCLAQREIERLGTHPSDTVRGWAAFAVGQDDNMSRMARLDAIKSYAGDPHFGVREWAWMAVRAIIVEQPVEAIARFSSWVKDDDPNIRRFASEATRPRGVWAASIPLLRKEPELALPILNPLRHDPHPYVEDSVANWINDAAKDNPDWVRALLSRWKGDAVSPRLLRRAGRFFTSKNPAAG